jgi:hypothetical protein
MAFRTLPISAILRSLLNLWGKLMEESLERPRMSIILTSCSGETVEECLRSIGGQKYPSFEVIIVDDFSNLNSSAQEVSLLTSYVNGLSFEVLGGLGVWCV